MKICLIEDDLELGNALLSGLQDEGQEVMWLRRVADAKHWVGMDLFDAVLLDLGLPDGNGLELLRFYEHYRFRYFAKKLALKQVRPLATDDSWSDDYYRDGDLRMLSRVRFCGR